MASESLLDTARSLFQAVDFARGVALHKETFEKFAAFLERTAFFLQELSRLEVGNYDSINGALESLKMEIAVARQLAVECTNGSKIYLLLSCKRIVEKLDNTSKNISRALRLFDLGSLGVPPETNESLMKLCKNMEDAQYQVCLVEEQILQKIETGIQDRNTDRSYASDLLVRIADCVGISAEHSELKTQFENFKNEMEGIESRTEASRMEQIVLLLGNADIVTTPQEKEMKYFTKRNSLGRRLLEPLHSFYCPITGDIMADPVETSSGHTFERAAIEKWIAQGNSLCPMTKTPLSRLSLRPNRTLRQSIEEWKNRNTMISIASMRPEIESSDEQELLHSLKKLHDLCERSELHREWIVMEEYIPIITRLLTEKNSEIKVRALSILYCLAKDGDSNKERIAEVNDSITYIVRSLARKVEESMLALQLLLELSRSTYVRNLIGSAQGCILLLVTLANSDDAQASKYAQEVLDNLAFLDQNVVQMARAKFFQPLLQRLSEGSLGVQMIMAETLANLELTDHNKLCLSRDGALKPLHQMIKHSNIEVKAVAVRALENLSGIAENGLQLIKEGAKTPLFELLFCHTLSSSKLREQVAKTIMHLAMSMTSPEASVEQIVLLETEDDIFKLFSLVSYTGPDTQQTLLRTFHALCKSPCGFNIRSVLRQICAVKVLVQLWEADALSVRADSVKLFYYLTEDGDHPTFLEHANKKSLATLVEIIKTSNNEEEIAAAMGIISHLPDNPQMSKNLLESGALEIIFHCLKTANIHSSHEKEVVGNASQALCRFTVPSNQECQKRVAEAGMIPILVKLLSSGTPFTKTNVAISLKQFSESSSNLSIPVKSRPLFCCFATSEDECPLHRGICSIDSSFCLLEAKAVGPLVTALGEADATACEASLDAILTLIDGVLLQRGCKVLEEAGAIPAMIKLLNSSCISLHRIFCKYTLKYSHCSNMSLLSCSTKHRTWKNAKENRQLGYRFFFPLNLFGELLLLGCKVLKKYNEI